jgi:hypothetical protein
MLSPNRGNQESLFYLDYVRSWPLGEYLDPESDTEFYSAIGRIAELGQ